MAVSGSGGSRKRSNSWKAVIRTQSNRYASGQRILVQCSSSLIRPQNTSQHSRLGGCEPDSAKNWSAPSRLCADERLITLWLYDIHNQECISPPPHPRRPTLQSSRGCVSHARDTSKLCARAMRLEEFTHRSRRRDRQCVIMSPHINFISYRFPN